MLNNVIDVNITQLLRPRQSNMHTDQLDLVMGFHDALYKLDIILDSEDAVIFSDESMEVISYNAILAGYSTLARESVVRIQHSAGSKGNGTGLYPQTLLKLLEEARHDVIDVTKTGKPDWTPVRQAIKQFGMRNSNCMVIAPTATISNIVGTIPCIEPIYKNIYVKANMNGDFIVINPYLVQDLKNRGLWITEILGTTPNTTTEVLQPLAIPIRCKRQIQRGVRNRSKWLIRTAAFRGKWIDQSQSLHLLRRCTSGRELANIYEYAWKMGLLRPLLLPPLIRVRHKLRSLLCLLLSSAQHTSVVVHPNNRCEGDRAISSTKHDPCHQFLNPDLCAGDQGRDTAATTMCSQLLIRPQPLPHMR